MQSLQRFLSLRKPALTAFPGSRGQGAVVNEKKGCLCLWGASALGYVCDSDRQHAREAAIIGVSSLCNVIKETGQRVCIPWDRGGRGTLGEWAAKVPLRVPHGERGAYIVSLHGEREHRGQITEGQLGCSRHARQNPFHSLKHHLMLTSQFVPLARTSLKSTWQLTIHLMSKWHLP